MNHLCIRFFIIGIVIIGHNPLFAQNTIDLSGGPNLAINRLFPKDGHLSTTKNSPGLGMTARFGMVRNATSGCDFRIGLFYTTQSFYEKTFYQENSISGTPPLESSREHNLTTIGITTGLGIRITEREKYVLRLVINGDIGRGRYSTRMYNYTEQLPHFYILPDLYKPMWMLGGRLGIEASIRVSEDGGIILQNEYGYSFAVYDMSNRSRSYHMSTRFISMQLLVGYRWKF